ncbi:MAG: hypothetical protein WA421_10845, partial [Nitrososphaeraceae archaeon]
VRSFSFYQLIYNAYKLYYKIYSNNKEFLQQNVQRYQPDRMHRASFCNSMMYKFGCAVPVKGII